MKTRTLKRWMTFAVIFLFFGLMGFNAVFMAPQASNQIFSAKVDSGPAIDGVVDELWDNVDAIQFQVFGGMNSSGATVTLKSVHTGDSIYFLAQWDDQTQSLRRFPWQKQEDGTWVQLRTNSDGDENLYYEDKLAFLWNINDSIAGFNQGAGCMVTCHPGEGKPFGNKYTASPGELGDIWHWKAVRSNPANYADDQFVDDRRFDPNDPSTRSAGRHSDPRFLGSYYNNVNADGTGPAFMAPTQPAPPYWIHDLAKLPFEDVFEPGDEVAGIITRIAQGDRGDITAKGVYEEGMWTVELARKLVTGSPRDIQFNDLSKSYFFGVSVFDNAQVRHHFMTGVNELIFEQ